MKNLKISLLTICLIFYFFLISGYCVETVKIKIMPFTIQSSEPLTFLEKGIQQMLISRLNIPDISEAALAPEDNHPSPQPDYILSGNILIFGNNVSTDAVLKQAGTEKTLLSFTKNGNSRGEVLSHINMLANAVKKDILNIHITELPPAPSYTSEASTPVSGKSRPDKEISSAVPGQKQPPNPLKIWKSADMDVEISSFSMGDATGNHRNETILCTEKTISVFKLENDKLIKLNQFNAKPNQKFITVDMADLNNNGKSEVYVTCIDKRTLTPQSLILEWSANELHPLKEYIKWIFRICGTDSNGNKILAGQKMSLGSNVLAPGIFRLNLDKSGELNSIRLELPEEVSLYSFTYGDVMNTGSDAIAAMSQGGTISIYSTNGELLWKGNDKYGGSNLFLEYKGYLYTRDDGFQLSRFFLQHRIIIKDFNNDGSNSILVISNKDSASGLLGKTRIYKKGSIISLKWDKMGLSPEKSTQSISGYISDFDIIDANSDGVEELVFSVVKTDGILSQNTSSTLYSLNSLTQNLKNSF